MPKLIYIFFCFFALSAYSQYTPQTPKFDLGFEWSHQQTIKSFCQLYNLLCFKGSQSFEVFIANDNIDTLTKGLFNKDIRSYIGNDYLNTFAQGVTWKLALRSNQEIGASFKMSAFTLPRGTYQHIQVDSPFGEIKTYVSAPYYEYGYHQQIGSEKIKITLYGGDHLIIPESDFQYFLTPDHQRHQTLDQVLSQYPHQGGEVVHKYQLMQDGSYHPIAAYLLLGNNQYRRIGDDSFEIVEEDTSQFYSNKTQLLFHFARLWNLSNKSYLIPTMMPSVIKGKIEVGVSVIDYQNHSTFYNATSVQELFHRIGNQTEFEYVEQKVKTKFYPKVSAELRSIFPLFKKFFIESILNLSLGFHESDRYGSVQIGLGIPVLKNRLQFKGNALLGVSDDHRVFAEEEKVSKRIGIEVEGSLSKRVTLFYHLFFFTSTRSFQPNFNAIHYPDGAEEFIKQNGSFRASSEGYDRHTIDYFRAKDKLGHNPNALPFLEIGMRYNLNRKN